jgi:hypothetical protein
VGWCVLIYLFISMGRNDENFKIKSSKYTRFCRKGKVRIVRDSYSIKINGQLISKKTPRWKYAIIFIYEGQHSDSEHSHNGSAVRRRADARLEKTINISLIFTNTSFNHTSTSLKLKNQTYTCSFCSEQDDSILRHGRICGVVVVSRFSNAKNSACTFLHTKSAAFKDTVNLSQMIEVGWLSSFYLLILVLIANAVALSVIKFSHNR